MMMLLLLCWNETSGEKRKDRFWSQEEIIDEIDGWLSCQSIPWRMTIKIHVWNGNRNPNFVSFFFKFKNLKNEKIKCWGKLSGKDICSCLESVAKVLCLRKTGPKRIAAGPSCRETRTSSFKGENENDCDNSGEWNRLFKIKSTSSDDI
jgi:hypothetical protein